MQVSYLIKMRYSGVTYNDERRYINSWLIKSREGSKSLKNCIFWLVGLKK